MPLKPITSLKNPQIKFVRSLALRKYREQTGVFLVEGERHVSGALAAGWRVQVLVVTDEVAGAPEVDAVVRACAAQGAQCLAVPAALMEQITKRANSQSVLAVVEQRWQELATLSPAAGDIWVGLEEIRDPGNLGTIMRTVDAVGGRGVMLIGQTCDPYGMEAIRATMGSFAHVALTRCRQAEFIDWTRNHPTLPIIGTHLKATDDFRAAPYAAPLVLLMGSEQAGLSEALTEACTQLVKIPMAGQAESLNVAVATGVVLYEVQR